MLVSFQACKEAGMEVKKHTAKRHNFFLKKLLSSGKFYGTFSNRTKYMYVQTALTDTGHQPAPKTTRVTTAKFQKTHFKEWFCKKI